MGKKGDADEAARVAAEEKAARDQAANEGARIAAEQEAARVAEELVEAADARIAASQNATDLARIAEEEEQEEFVGEVGDEEHASDDEVETPSSGRRLQQAGEDDWIRKGDADEAARVAAEEKAARDQAAAEG